MNRMMIALSVVVLMSGCCTKPVRSTAYAPRISVFGYVVGDVVKQHGVSMAEAGRMLVDAGVTGFDCSYCDKHLDEYLQSGLEPVNFYGFIDFYAADGGKKACDEYVASAVRHGVRRIMCIPPNFTDGKENEVEFSKSAAGLKYLVSKATPVGITVTIEDFGDDKNPCSYSKYLKRFMTEIPELRYTLDSGNLHFSNRGDDILEMMRWAKGRIAHVHLKDMAKGSRFDVENYVTIGLGKVPNAGIVREMDALGYCEWYTLENLIGDDALEDIHRQVAVLHYWCGK